MSPLTCRLLAALCLTATGGQAAPLDLNAFLSAVKTAHPAMQAAQAEAESRAALLRQEATPYNPSLAMEGGGKSSDAAQGTLFGATLSQGFAWPGKRAVQRHLAQQAVDAIPLARHAVEARIVRETMKAVLALAEARQHWANALDRQEHLEPVQAFLRSQTFASPQQQTDRAVVETRLRNQTAQRARAKAELDAATDAVRALAAGAELTWDLPANLSFSELPSLDAVLSSNPEIGLTRLERAQAEAQVAWAAKQGLPDPELSLGYEREELGGTEQSLRGGLNLSLPLLNTNRAGKEAAEHGLIAATAKSAAVERALRQETLALLRRLQSLRAAAAAYPKGSLEALEKGLKEAERQLKVGRLALISYLELEAEAAETRETLLSLGLEQAHVLVDLQALAGAVDAPPALLAVEGSHVE